MVFGFLKKKAEVSLNKYSGNKDFLEATCAAIALVTAADGEIEDDEVAQAVESVKANASLNAAYATAEIEECIDRMLKLTKTPSGRVKLGRELDDVAKKDIDTRQDVYLAALDVSLADGEMEPAEKDVLAKIAKRLDVNAEALGL